MATARDGIKQLESRIHLLRTDLLDAYVTYIEALDEQEDWPKLVKAARAAGLSKDSLCKELGCAWSTIIRWQAGQSAPGPFARTGIKEKLVEMLVALQEARPRKAKPQWRETYSIKDLGIVTFDADAATRSPGFWPYRDRIVEVGDGQFALPEPYVQKVG